MNSDSFPTYRGLMEYVCVQCGKHFPASDLLYSCPACNGVLLLEDQNFAELKKTSGAEWRKIFDHRQSSRISALRGVFRFYELMAPIFSEDDILYLGEGATPVIEAAPRFQKETGARFAYKNDGQNPSASFKDRGMACAFSYLKWLCRSENLKEILAICASTGDTSAAAALYAAYVGPPVKCVVLLPRGKVTPQQLSQPLGSGATVLEIPGVFDDCMKVVEALADNYNVALLNSKNSWRILGQESYAFECAQWHNWKTDNLVIFVPIGNAGNISAIMSGFLKLYDLKIIDALPKIFGAQSSHADPVYRYYATPASERQWRPVQVQPSVAQAAMIGNPVSFPRVAMLAKKYTDIAGPEAFQVMQVSEQEIMEGMLLANRNGHIACTQGGECLAALKKAISAGKLAPDAFSILDSTAHALKFAIFQDKYFNDSFEKEYEIVTTEKLRNMPVNLLEDKNLKGQALTEAGASAIASLLHLKPKKRG